MKNNLKVAVIGAMDCEINTLKECLKDIETIEYGKLTVFKGRIGNNEIILTKSGVGKVCAAINTQFIIDKFQPDCIINTGVAGGIAQELEVGDIVIATSLVQHDFDATALGYVKGYACTGGDNQKPTWFYTDEKLIKAFETAISKVHTTSKIYKGVIATGDMFIGTPEKKTELRELFNATAAEMESSAIAQTANTNDIPCLVIRAISDLADCTANKPFAEVEKQMAEVAASTIEILLDNL
ncbi:5'-methylthioadenosine/adenosylhomocysteine nucleosidase [bacterium]|nr:5'-methylthioadenosine/adenosylhomocysteine nucleosidase [bacterium]